MGKTGYSLKRAIDYHAPGPGLESIDVAESTLHVAHKSRACTFVYASDCWGATLVLNGRSVHHQVPHLLAALDLVSRVQSPGAPS